MGNEKGYILFRLTLDSIYYSVCQMEKIIYFFFKFLYAILVAHWLSLWRFDLVKLRTFPTDCPCFFSQH